MATFSFINSKGGVSKSTTLICFAAYLAKKGYKVSILDTDTGQSAESKHAAANADGWAKETFDKYSCYPDNILYVEKCGDVAKLSADVAKLEEVSDFVLIDTAGTNSLLLSEALVQSDLAVYCTGAKNSDVKSAPILLELIERAEKKVARIFPWKANVAAIVNRGTCSPIVPKAEIAVHNKLRELGVAVIPQGIPERKEYDKIWHSGSTLYQLLDEAKTDIEQRDLTKAIKDVETSCEALLDHFNKSVKKG